MFPGNGRKVFTSYPSMPVFVQNFGFPQRLGGNSLIDRKRVKRFKKVKKRERKRKKAQKSGI